MKEFINYNGKNYDLEIIKGYYDFNIGDQICSITEQEFFDEYIKLDPSFTELFEHDICSIPIKIYDTYEEFVEGFCEDGGFESFEEKVAYVEPFRGYYWWSPEQNSYGKYVVAMI